MAQALPFDSEANARAYINKHLKPEHGRSPDYSVVPIKAQFMRTQFASFNMWQALQLEKAVLVLSPSSVITENWTGTLKEPGHPEVFTWVDCIATPMLRRTLALAASKHIQIAHCDYKF